MSIRTLILCGLASAFGLCARAQYSVDWYTFDGGGDASTGGVYSITGTIGQPDAGTMTGGNYTLQGGFWGVVAAVQSPGAPYLWVTHTATNTVVIWWALSDTSWRLRAATSVAAGSAWTDCSYQTNGATCCRIESPPAGNRYYRLLWP